MRKQKEVTFFAEYNNITFLQIKTRAICTIRFNRRPKNENSNHTTQLAMISYNNR